MCSSLVPQQLDFLKFGVNIVNGVKINISLLSKAEARLMTHLQLYCCSHKIVTDIIPVVCNKKYVESVFSVIVNNLNNDCYFQKKAQLKFLFM